MHPDTHTHTHTEIEVNLLQQQFDFTEGQDRGTIKICANHTGQIQRMRTLIVAVTAELGNGTVTCESGIEGNIVDCCLITTTYLCRV